MSETKRLQRAREIFDDLLEVPESEREEYLGRACEGDDALADLVSKLLRASADADAANFMATEAMFREGGPGGGARIGDQVGPYLLESLLGEGGMGVVFLAKRVDKEFEQSVAIKMLHRGTASDQLVRRFRGERQILAHLDHPSIARLLDGGSTDNGKPYLVMEYVAGQPIDTYCDEHKLSVKERLRLFRKVCEPVHYAHQNLIVHRDLKPTNVLVTEEGTVKLLDFGIAKLLDPALKQEETVAGHRPMTPTYASPEQIRGQPISTASDIYSLGVLLYKLLTGAHPHGAARASVEGMSEAMRESDPVFPSAQVSRLSSNSGSDTEGSLDEEVFGLRSTTPRRLHRSLSGDLDNIVIMALHQEPNRRYASAEQFSEDVDRHLRGDPVISRAATARYRIGKFVGRHKAGVTVALAVFLALGTLVGLLFRQNRIVEAERDRANKESAHAQSISSFLVDVFQWVDPQRSRGREVTIREILDRTSAMFREQGGPLEPSSRARFMRTIGEVHLAVGDYSQGQELFAKSLDLTLDLGPEHSGVADSYKWLGTALWYLDDLHAAEEAFDAALELRTRILGLQHPDTLSSMADLGALLSFEEEWARAWPYLEEALSSRREVLGDEHRDTLTSVLDMGSYYLYRGETKSAFPLLMEAFEGRRKTLGEEHPETLESMDALGRAYRSSGDWARAQELLRGVVQGRRKVLGPDHSITLSSENNLGLFFLGRREFGEACSLLNGVLERRQSILGETHSQTLVSMANYGSCLDLSGRTVKDEQSGQTVTGEMVLRRAYLGRIAVLGKDARLTLRSQARLGEALVRMGRFDEAKELISSAHERLCVQLGMSHRNVGIARRAYGEYFAAVGEPEKARSHLDAALAILLETEGTRSVETRAARDALARLP